MGLFTQAGGILHQTLRPIAFTPARFHPEPCGQDNQRWGLS